MNLRSAFYGSSCSSRKTDRDFVDYVSEYLGSDEIVFSRETKKYTY